MLPAACLPIKTICKIVNFVDNSVNNARAVYKLRPAPASRSSHNLLLLLCNWQSMKVLPVATYLPPPLPTQAATNCSNFPPFSSSTFQHCIRAQRSKSHREREREPCRKYYQVLRESKWSTLIKVIKCGNCLAQWKNPFH